MFVFILDCTVTVICVVACDLNVNLKRVPLAEDNVAEGGRNCGVSAVVTLR